MIDCYRVVYGSEKQMNGRVNACVDIAAEREESLQSLVDAVVGCGCRCWEEDTFHQVVVEAAVQTIRRRRRRHC